MRRTRLGFAIGTSVIIAGAAAYYTGHLEQVFQFVKRDSARLKEKERQVSSNIHKMIESENATKDEVVSEVRKAERPVVRNSFEVVVGQNAAPATTHSGAKACTPIEYAGSGPDAIRFESQVWTRFMADYHQAKEDLVHWLHGNAEQFPKGQLARMEMEIRETRVMRPQSQIEPDLTFRGIAAWTRPRAGTIVEGERPALIHVTDGFLKLYQKDRARARFEMTRTLAQAWAPCELGGDKSFAAWNGLLQCLGFQGEQASCNGGTISEAAWASSTAVAVLVSPPGCEIPAFQGDRYQACLGGFKRAETAGYEIETPNRKIASQSVKEE